MSKEQQRRQRTPEHPSDKYARSHEAPPPSGEEPPERLSERNGEDLVEEASEDSFPTSDPPSYARGSSKHTTAREE
ncbi:MAG: hypothetical protein ACRDJW_21830 [Thermomicrobiales bacterium]